MSLFNIGFVIFPNLTQLDFTGPLQVLSRLPQSTIHIVAKSREPVPSDCGLSLLPTHTFADCPPLDLICVPGGGNGVVAAANDQETIDFVRRQASACEICHIDLYRRLHTRSRRGAPRAAGDDTLGLY